MKTNRRQIGSPEYVRACRGLSQAQVGRINEIAETMANLGILSEGDWNCIRQLLDAIEIYEKAKDQLDTEGFTVSSTNEKGTVIKQSPAFGIYVKASNLMGKLSAELGLTTMSRKKLSVLTIKSSKKSIAEELGEEE